MSFNGCQRRSGWSGGVSLVNALSAARGTVNIRKFVAKASKLADLVELGTLSTQAADFLEACVVAGLNIVVAGGTQAGSKPRC
jgi:Flp pilus assembly CpaF family ATPase